MASMKRDLPLCDPSHLKRARVGPESQPAESFAACNVRVVLNPADCDIDFNVQGDGLQGSALYEEGFVYCWSGARANIGINRGKYCFGVKIVSEQPVDIDDTPLHPQHVCRIGISRGDDDVRNLGETLNSFGFGGTGKFSNSGTFVNYGESFGVGDTIVCAVDLDSRPMASIGFSKNGKWLGVAQCFDAGLRGLWVVDSPIKNLRWESALFPHILVKNVVVQLQFSIHDGLVPVEGYKPWDAAILDHHSISGPTFSNPSDCEVIMMVGLPASGKTTWAEKWVKEHPEKRYVLLGTNLALEQMKVPGLLRNHNYGQRFDQLMGRATEIFNTLLSRASKMPRNFIIDQTNVYKSARKRKLKPFADYIKVAAVVFPRAEELKFRACKRFEEMGKEVPAEAVNEMLANFTLPMSKDMPRTDEYFDQVWFVELNGAESQRSLDEMKREMPVTFLKNPQKAPIQSTYSSQPLSGIPAGSYVPSLSTQGLRHAVPTHGHQSYRVDYAHSHIGLESRSHMADPYWVSSTLSYSGGTPLDFPAVCQSSYPSATPYQYAGSSGVQIPYGSFPSDVHSTQRPPTMDLPMNANPLVGSFHNEVQHGGAYPQPPTVRPPSLEFPSSVQHPSFCPPRPGWY